VRTLKEEGGSKEEEDTAVERVRDIYERAVAQVPPGKEKRHWRRYIFLWLDYALFEEIETQVCVFPFLLNIVRHSIEALLGLRASKTGVPNNVKSCASQAIHICEGMDYVS
jgi:hypothetical protein